MDSPWSGIVFWIGFFVWLVVLRWTRLLREKERHQTLRSIAERGTQLDTQTLERLFPGGAGRMRTAETIERALIISGTVMMFLGVGMLIGARLIGRIDQDALFGMSTGGTITIFIGIGFVVSVFVMRRFVKKSGQPSTGTDTSIS